MAEITKVSAFCVPYSVDQVMKPYTNQFDYWTPVQYFYFILSCAVCFTGYCGTKAITIHSLQLPLNLMGLLISLCGSSNTVAFNKLCQGWASVLPSGPPSRSHTGEEVMKEKWGNNSAFFRRGHFLFLHPPTLIHARGIKPLGTDATFKPNYVKCTTIWIGTVCQIPKTWQGSELGRVTVSHSKN